ncbi:MFS transporter [Streptomyces diastatochromogenes]|nr:MFS transporter [Streptomyces diastatochromogenes]
MRETNDTDGGPDASRGSRIRWQVVTLLFAAVVINYIDRSSLSVALPAVSRDLGLDDGVSGLVLGAFFWTYAAFQIPTGRLVDRLGARTVLAAAALSWSLATALTGLAATGAWLLGFRLLLGAAQAALFPAATSCVERWFPRDERALASGVYDSGARVGTLLAIPVFSALVAGLGWRTAFAAVGLAGVVWTAVWWRLFRDEPARHPGVSEAELRRIDRPDPAGDPTARDTAANPGGAPCYAAGRSGAPSSPSSPSRTSSTSSSPGSPRTSSTPGDSPCSSSASSGRFPRWRPSRGTGSADGPRTPWCGAAGRSPSPGRAAARGPAGLGLGGGGGGRPGAGAALALLSLSFAGVSFATSVLLTVPADISPPGSSVAGTLQSVQNTFSGIAGIASPLVIGFLKGATGSFVPGLLSAAFVAVLGCLALLFLVDRIDQDVLREDARRSCEPRRTRPRWTPGAERQKPGEVRQP